MPNVIVAAIAIVLAVLRSILEGHLLVARLGSRPAPPIGRWLGGRILRCSWHSTSVAGLALWSIVLERSRALRVASLALVPA